MFVKKLVEKASKKDPSNWVIVEPLPSYGRGIELPGGRYGSLISGYMLKDVVITGDNGTIDGQGSVWWDLFSSHTLNYIRPNLVEFIKSNNVVVSNLTFLNSPAWTIHPVYCSNVHIQNLVVHAPPESPKTSGIVPGGMCLLSKPAKSFRASHCQATDDWFWWCGQFRG